MIRLYHPDSIARFRPEEKTSALSCVAYDAVAALGPRCVVDLACGSGTVFFAECQAMVDHDHGGMCYAVDAFASAEGQRDSATVRARVNASYRGVGCVLSARPAEVSASFAEGSVDLLRFGSGMAEADAAVWLDRLSRAGVGLCEASLLERCRAHLLDDFETAIIDVDGGIGLFRRRTWQGRTGELLTLAFSKDSADTLSLAHVYEHAAHYHALRAAVLPHWMQLARAGKG